MAKDIIDKNYNELMDKHAEDLDAMNLPFKWQYIPLDYPQPEYFM